MNKKNISHGLILCIFVIGSFSIYSNNRIFTNWPDENGLILENELGNDITDTNIGLQEKISLPEKVGFDTDKLKESSSEPTIFESGGLSEDALYNELGNIFGLKHFEENNQLKVDIPTKDDYKPAESSATTSFISSWNTTKSGSSASNQITLPLESSGTYNFEANWGDGSSDIIESYNQPEVTHTFASEGIYTVVIDGELNGWRFNNGGDKLKIIEISQWGTVRLGNSGSYFAGAENLVLTATDSLDLTGTTSLYMAFYNCVNLGDSGSMNGWDVSSVTNMSFMFAAAETFNMSIGSWDVSSVTTMDMMFAYAYAFNQPLDTWDMSSVTNMTGMFAAAINFNRPLDTWDVSSVTNMTAMFGSAMSFNQSISSWDVSSVISMALMFAYTPSFNKPIGNWDVSSVLSMYFMFASASSFNQPIDNWDVSSVTDMTGIFSSASSFNQSLNIWDTSSVINMNNMFSAASSFNQSLNNWDTSSVTDMNRMFYYAPSFNQPLDSWNVVNVTDMNNMFSSAFSFNQSLASWDVSNVTDMSGMFSSASSFNQPLGSWDVSNVTSMDEMFSGITLSTPNYDDLLIGWAQLTLKQNVNLNAGNSQYSKLGSIARSYIISTFSWTIFDGGLMMDPSLFISRWDTTWTDFPGSSSSNQVALPLESTGTYDFNVSWGDGLSNIITSYNQPEVNHTYASEGTYTIIINGTLNGWRFNFTGDHYKILEVSQWGNLKLGNSGSYFAGATNLVLTATDSLDLTGTTSLYQAFYQCESLGSIGSMNNWDVSSVTDMDWMFTYDDDLNMPIGSWDVSSVTTMRYMFLGASSFNQPLDTWDVSSVTNMHYMFISADAFNQPLGSWDVSSVTDMSGMFYTVTLSTPNYDDLLVGWSQLPLQSNVQFHGGYSKYGELGLAARAYIIATFGWTISDGGFDYDSFTPFISVWDTTQMSSGSSDPDQIDLPLESSGTYNFNVSWGDDSFDIITSYNQPEVTHTYASGGTYTLTVTGIVNGWSFNNDGDKLKIIEISQWGDIKLGNSGYYFYGASNLILTATDSLDLTGTISLYMAFYDCSNLGNIGSMSSWDVSSVTDMSGMFLNATSFNQPLGGWDVSSVTNMDFMLANITLTAPNYDNLLVSWAQLTLQIGVTFDGGNSKYSILGENARNKILTDFGWTITDGGMITVPSAPQLLGAIVGVTYVNLTWSASTVDGGSAITGYVIYRSSTSGTGYVMIDSVSETTLKYKDETIANGQTYFYIVKAKNYAGESVASNEVSANIPAGVASAPQSLAITIGDTFVNLTWSNPISNGGSSITSYTIYRSITSTSGYSEIGTVAGGTLTFKDNSVTQGQTYYYYVTAVNAIGESEGSNIVSGKINVVTTTPPTTTTTPTSTSSSSVPSSTSKSGSSPGFEIYIFLFVIMTAGFIRRLKKRN